MAGLTEFYCPSNETSHASQFKWLDNTFIYGEIFPHFLIYWEAFPHIWLCNCSTLNFLIYGEKIDFLFYQCGVACGKTKHNTRNEEAGEISVLCLLQNPSYRKLNHTERDLRSTITRGIKLTEACTVVLSSNSEKVISDLKRDNQFFQKRSGCLYDWSLERDLKTG